MTALPANTLLIRFPSTRVDEETAYGAESEVRQRKVTHVQLEDQRNDWRSESHGSDTTLMETSSGHDAGRDTGDYSHLCQHNAVDGHESEPEHSMQMQGRVWNRLIGHICTGVHPERTRAIAVSVQPHHQQICSGIPQPLRRHPRPLIRYLLLKNIVRLMSKCLLSSISSP